ncbi:hypothetical protein [Microbacterium sp. CFBP9034]|uniref:hypothetical protein n=1 Tax=Microbacterium sp. CFBP9034 TaxID=3096540 RepID=UPI002A6B0656|nr:hypothetical protein [Microbacterium sp. CFBP9034]MDY0910327.1 hypothetical protein [Microbacterium sp. CFBP9034]
MSSLRAELGGSVPPPTPYSILCPPAWRRVAPSALLEEDTSKALFDTMKGAGRADLVLEMRTMLSQYRRSIRDLNAFDMYLPPLVDGVMIPASLLVSPLVLPTGVDWDAALVRLARGNAVDEADFTETRMWVWRRSDTLRHDSVELGIRESTYIVPVPEEAAMRRALRFQFTVLVTPGAGADAETERLLALGDLMMSTMNWRLPGSGRR